MDDTVLKISSLIANMKTVFMYVDEDMGKKILARPTLKLAALAWSPRTTPSRDVSELEGVQ